MKQLKFDFISASMFSLFIVTAIAVTTFGLEAFPWKTYFTALVFSIPWIMGVETIRRLTTGTTKYTDVILNIIPYGGLLYLWYEYLHFPPVLIAMLMLYFTGDCIYVVYKNRKNRQDA